MEEEFSTDPMSVAFRTRGAPQTLGGGGPTQPVASEEVQEAREDVVEMQEMELADQFESAAHLDVHGNPNSFWNSIMTDKGLLGCPR